MPTHLARYFQKKRMEKGQCLGQIARMLGYANASKGARRVQTFEQTGKIDGQLLVKLAAVLEIDGKTRRRLLRKDYLEWFTAKNRAVAPYLLRTGVWGVPEPFLVPKRLKTAEELEAYAADVARRCGWGLFLYLSERIRIYFSKDGSFREIFEEVPRGEGTC